MRPKPNTPPKQEEKQDYGDFEEVVDENEKKPQTQMGQEAPVRARLPRQGEKIGTVIQRLGGNRMLIKTNDGKTINARVPGRFKRSMWLRLNDVVLIETWENDEEKADIIFKYSSGAINQLRKRGLLSNVDAF